MSEKTLEKVEIVKKLDDFDRIVTKEMNIISKILYDHGKGMKKNAPISLYKRMVEKNLMQLDSAIDVFTQGAEEWMDKIKGD